MFCGSCTSMESYWFLLLVLLLVLASALSAPAADEECQQDVNCFLPNCLCASTKPPGGLSLEEVPQFVVLSYDDAITTTNFDFYLDFKDFVNPNECRISMTFFVSHLYCDYSKVNELHRLGHEIALHSVTHKSDVENYWRKANQSVWEHEMDDLRKMIVRNALIPVEDIKGWRAPFLEVGGDEMFSAVRDLNLLYDCSWPTLKYTNWYGDRPEGAIWPYTLDFPSIQDCQVGRCPTERFNGTWVLPMVDLKDNTGEGCAMLDICRSVDDELLTSADAVENFLRRNFNLNYYTNKAPFGLYAHHAWFYENQIDNTEARKDGYTRFLQWLSEKDDVYVVSLDRMLAWVRNPVPLSEAGTSDALSCTGYDPDSNCLDPIIFDFFQEDNLPTTETMIRMGTCTRPQPDYYPWIYNPYGDQDIPIEAIP
ncbi:chitin deacetylase 7 isoform X1 [Procambarus clarkii]|uniref:chitin deacetylase 7 isoform X1 n=1 Tax=Procambarus clarkii TaxID=6728 RepID=UPI0037445CD5